MNEDIHRFCDIILKSLTILVTLTGIFFGYREFILEWEKSNQKPYLEMRSKYYLEMVEITSKIAYPISEEEQLKSIRKFWQAYVGVSALVEDKDVEDKVTNFSLCLDYNEIVCKQLELESYSLQLSSAVRGSLLKSWGLIKD